MIERFGGRVPKLPHADRIIAEGAGWIAYDGLRLTLAKPIELLVADGTGRGTYLPIAPAGVRMPVENDNITLTNCKFFCVDPRDGAAIFEFAKPRAAGFIQPSDDRETICVATLPVDPIARPLLERLECEVRIDHDYIAHATLRSRGRQESAQFEFHQLDFGLTLPSEHKGETGPVGRDDTPSSEGGDRKPLSLSSAPRSNITLRSNLTPTDEDSWASIADWRMVPGDIVEKWQTAFIGPRLSELSQMQKDERDYYLPCSRCGRTLYTIRTEGPNEICEKYRCSEAKSRQRRGQSGPAP